MNTIVSADGERTETRGKWTFKGVDGSKGLKHGKQYRLKVYINHDPQDFFIYAYPTWTIRADGVFYDSHESFDTNWTKGGSDD